MIGQTSSVYYTNVGPPGLTAMTDAERWIRDLQLQRHPEGGWFREVYRATETIPRRSLPARFAADRSHSTAIYFLLEGSDFSALHRLKQDELWHFYDGGRVTLEMIDSDGDVSTAILGLNVDTGERPMAVVEAGSLFGATAEVDSYGLVGCTVAPGFDFNDFDMPSREQLLDQFPQHSSLIRRLTRERLDGR